MRPLDQLLKDSFRLIRADPKLYVGLVAIAAVPALMLTVLVPASRSKEALNAAFEADQVGVILLVAFGSLVSRLLDSYVGVAAILAAHERDKGGHPDLPGALSKAAKVYWEYLVTGMRALAWIVGGLFLFVVPGLIMALRYALIPYAVLVEGRTGDDALERSSQLCKARPGKIYGNLIVAAIVIVLAGSFFSAVAGLALPSVLDELLAKIVDGVAGTWLAAFAVLLYKDAVKVVE